ncbi:MAG: transcriptional regulator [Planctomycetes bacterium DG_23]|nr:MAG: transcriptional regulator [Planctomycetes bacterium DG_23]
MSGHSHWAGIKHKKGAADAKKGRLFSKLARNITVAARTGGKDPSSNVKLRYAIEKARAANMPKDSIERAIKKGTGELPGQVLEARIYEGYGPGGVAIILETLTDNLNRTAAELRHIFEGSGGKLAQRGSVAYMFETKGLFTVRCQDADEDGLMLLAIEAGAENMRRVGDEFEIICRPEDFERLKQALQENKILTQVAEITQSPKVTVDLDEAQARKVVSLLEALEESEDVQKC